MCTFYHEQCGILIRPDRVLLAMGIVHWGDRKENQNCIFADRPFCNRKEVREGLEAGDGSRDYYGNWAHWDCVILECREDFSQHELEEMGLDQAAVVN